jgi:hypothetical protein
MRNPRGSGIAKPDPDQGYAGLTASCHSRRNRHPDRRTLSTPAGRANPERSPRAVPLGELCRVRAPLGVGSPDTRRSGVAPLSPHCRASSAPCHASGPCQNHWGLALMAAAIIRLTSHETARGSPVANGLSRPYSAVAAASASL